MIRLKTNLKTDLITRCVHVGVLLNHIPSIVNDGNTVARFDRTVPEGVVKDVNGVESIYWDLMTGNQQRGAEQASGNIILYAVYEITATTADFFYAGCAVGDIFPCGVVKTCTALNKVKRVLGNHVCQPVFSRRPINGVFDGVDDFMKSAPFAYNQPEMAYLALNQLTYKLNSYIFDGDLSDSGSFHQHSGTASTLTAYAGATMNSPYNQINKLNVIRVVLNGANSRIQIDDEANIWGDAGVTKNLGGITLGRPGGVSSSLSNIYIKEAIFRKVADSPLDEKKIFDYLSKKHKTNRTKFGGKVIFTYDDGFSSDYTHAFPLHQAKGIPGTFSVLPSLTGTAGYTTWEQLREMSAIGLEIASHGYTATNLNTMTEVQIRASFDNVNAAFAANEIPLPETIAYSGGQYNDLVKSISAEYYNLGRTVLSDYIKTPRADKFILPGWDISQNIPHTLQSVKDKIDYAMKYNYILIFMLHKIVDGAPGAGYDINVNELSDIMDYCISVNADVVNFKDLYQTLQ